MNGIEFEILKLWRDIPGLSFIEFDEKYFKFRFPEYSNRNYALFDDTRNLILKSELWRDYQIILNKEMRN